MIISIEQAFLLLEKHVAALASQRVNLDQAVGRVLREPVTSDIDSPPHRKSLMDGFAIRSQDLNQGTQRFRIVETIVAGRYPEKAIGEGTASRIMTGAPMPEGADAVVMIEDTDLGGAEDSFVQVKLDQLAPAKHVIDQAAHFGEGDLLFAAGHRVRPTDLGLLAEAGAAQLTVSPQLSVAILPTGDELVDLHERPQRGQIRNSNGPMLAAMARQLGLRTTLFPIAVDEASALEAAISTGLKHDLLILTGGVSEGILDLVPRTLAKLGVNEIFHKVQIKPGKPIWFGKIDRTQKHVNSKSGSQPQLTYVFGLPGNPVSSLVGFQLFVRTAIRLMEGLSPAKSGGDSQITARPKFLVAELFQDHETRGDRPTFWPARRFVDRFPRLAVEALAWRGSSDLLSLREADGLIHFAALPHLHRMGSQVEFLPFDNF